MLRWFDYVVVFFFADIMAGAIVALFTAPQLVFSLVLVPCLAWFGFDAYTEMRKAYEDQKD
jgi:hypothetical protein